MRLLKDYHELMKANKAVLLEKSELESMIEQIYNEKLAL